MTIDPALVGWTVARLAEILLFVAIASLLVHDLAAGISLLTVQALVLLTVGILVALGDGAVHAWAAVAATLVVKVILIPWRLRSALERLRVRREIEPVLPGRVVLVIAIALTGVVYRAVGPLQLPGAEERTLPAAIGLMMIGLLMMVVRRKALSQVLGLVTLENGIYLAALALTEGLPWAVELAVAFDLLVGVILLAIFVQSIGQTFDSTSIDRLRRLRDRPVRLPPT